MKVWVKRPTEQYGHIEEVKNELKALQDIVEGNIETFQFASDFTIVCNEEGIILGLPYNCCVLGYTFYGTIFAVGVDGEQFCDIPEAFESFWRRCVL